MRKREKACCREFVTGFSSFWLCSSLHLLDNWITTPMPRDASPHPWGLLSPSLATNTLVMVVAIQFYMFIELSRQPEKRKEKSVAEDLKEAFYI